MYFPLIGLFPQFQGSSTVVALFAHFFPNIFISNLHPSNTDFMSFVTMFVGVDLFDF